MRFVQFALVALVGLEGVYAGGNHGKGHHGPEGIVEHLVKPTYPKKTDTYANRARPLKPSTNKKGVNRRDLSPSLDGSCGEGKTCDGSPFGPCCSKDGWCGSSLASCGDGCLELYGICTSARLAERAATDSASASACDAPSSSGAASSGAASSGAANIPAVQSSTTIKASTTSSKPPTSTSKAAAATSTAAALKVSTDGKCGATAKSTCTGSKYGTCCSKNNQCGNSNTYCLKTQGCQPLYGKCT